MPDEIKAYMRALQHELATGKAREHSYRPALKNLLESSCGSILAQNDPARVECGAPDFIITRKNVPVGYVECKDIGDSLSKTEKTPQLKRYLRSLSNFILTDYLAFRYYQSGSQVMEARLARIDSIGRLKVLKNGTESVARLLDAFFAHEGPSVNNPRELASQMARLAGLIREVILNTVSHESASGSLHEQMKAFADTLIHDLSAEQFADMYAQTICYGLFAARYSSANPKTFSREKAAYELPKTNPFLRSMFGHIAGPDLDDRVTWAVDDLVYLLRRADMAAILKDFGKHTRREDPIVHFYETFLAAYDPKLRESRGVYYTPEPVVSYIVRSVDHILKTDFGLPDGLADASKVTCDFQKPHTGESESRTVHKVQILDPACGTGTFLHAVIAEIRESFKGNEGAWSSYVREHLLPRLFGFELLMAPYAVAHMKLGLQLDQSGYDFSADERLNIFLTNTLEAAEFAAAGLFGEMIAKEANAASTVKRDVPIMVVLGNPPYSGLSANMKTWVADLLKGKLPDGKNTSSYYEVDGKPLGEKKVWLQDDYVKFIRWGQWRIEKTGCGILAFITNHGYLDNPTFRGMRQSLMKTFDDIYVLDLHGNSKKKETAPDGSKDENVFDIQQGVAIGIFVKRPSAKSSQHTVNASGLYGSRESKYSHLRSSTTASTVWSVLSPAAPYRLFAQTTGMHASEYTRLTSITQALPISTSGIVTARDSIVLDFDSETLLKRIRVFRRSDLSDDDIREKYFVARGSPKYPPGDTRGWKLGSARDALRTDSDWHSRVTACLYRPFDSRSLYYTPTMVDWPRTDVMRHMLAGRNMGLTIGRAGQAIGRDVWDICYSTADMTDLNLFRRGGNTLFPLYLYPSAEGKEVQTDHMESPAWPPGRDGRVPNLSPDFVADFTRGLGLSFVSDAKGDLKKTFGPEDIFHYIYAVFHSPTYRKRYAEFLKIDFPRVPITSDVALFRKLCALGAELVGLHLLERVPEPSVTFPVSGNNTVEKVRYEPPTPAAVGARRAVPDSSGRVYINKDQYFDNVPPEVWEFHIGGYQVADKWLKDRKGRALSYDNITHYRKTLTALGETIRLMSEIDAGIPKWPIE